MIPVIRCNERLARAALPAVLAAALVGAAAALEGAQAADDASRAPVRAGDEVCLPSGDGYFRARLGGSVVADLDWPNSGTHCEGEPKEKAAGVRMSFRRAAAGSPDLLFVFGMSGVREGIDARLANTNLTLIVQGTDRVYGTLGDSRCTVDSLSQRRLPGTDPAVRSYRVEARGFCTQPARAVRGYGEVLVSTFDFAGIVNYSGQ